MRTLSICVILASALLTTSPALAQKPSSTTQDQRRAEMRQRYEKLNTADKRRVDDITHKIRELNDERLRILGYEPQPKTR